MPGIQPPDCSNLAKNLKNDNDVTIFRHDVFVKYFWRCFVSIVKFSYWFKFHVNIITGSGIITIFFYKGLTEIRKSEIPPSEFCPISGDQVRDTKYGTNVSNKILLNAAKFQGYSSYRFWVIKGKPTSGGEITPLPLPPKLGLNFQNNCFNGYSINLHYLKWAVGIFLLLQSD